MQKRVTNHKNADFKQIPLILMWGNSADIVYFRCIFASAQMGCKYAQ